MSLAQLPLERSAQSAAADVVRTGLVLTVIAFALVMLLGATYWRWLGYM